ncbi:hypothetical protein QBZ16_002774 [Prototheca wickerhamii]|uniref:Uncharacterized protein n=1 Tax=Prototheca wickerhamii TaxID=3111 RepID=A0AAD9IIE4_PROWI|nr:hypothetical protein QBZ16_002774 [Prototheca wickerhamii]
MRLAQEELDAERHKGSPSAWEGLYPPIFPQAPSPPPAEEAQPIDDLEEALRQSSMHAERLESQRRLALESDQNELDRVMLASLSTAVFDEILRDILCWIRDLQGACDAVAAALGEVAALRASLEDQEAGASDDSSLARAFWLSEQYERVAGRLRDLGRRLEPIEEAVAAFRSLEAYVRDSQPSKAETEEQRDAILAAMFEALSQQGLEAHHPFGAWGSGAQGEGYGSDLRGLVDGLIDEAKRIPMYPAFEEESQEPETVPAVEEAPLEAELVDDGAVLGGKGGLDGASLKPHKVVDDAEAGPSAPLTPVEETSTAHRQDTGPWVGEELVSLPPEPCAKTVSAPEAEPSAPLLADGGSLAAQAGSTDAAAGGVPRLALPDLFRSPAPSPARDRPASTRALGPNLRTANVRRTPRQPVERRPEDAITRMPPLLPLRHQLDKDGWLGRLARVPAAAQGRADAPAPTAADVPLSKLRDLGQRIQSAQLSTVQEVCDFVASIVEESGAESAAALGVAGVAAAAAAGDASLWPRERWSAAAAVTRVCDELGDCIDRLAHWRVPPGATPAEERLRLLAAAARAVATLGVQSVRSAGGGSWSAAQTLEPLVAAFDAVFAIHQFAQGLNRAAGEAVSELVRQTTHFARMVDPLWVRDTKWA